MENIITSQELLSFLFVFGKSIIQNFGLAILAYIICHVSIRIAMAQDKKSALARCKRLGQPIISSKQRQASNKANEYFRDLRADALIDILWMLSAFIIMRSWTSLSIPLFPVFAIYRAVCIVLIERRSIHENSSKSYQGAVKDSEKEILKLVRSKPELATALLKLIKK